MPILQVIRYRHTQYIYLYGHVGNEQHSNAVYMKHYTDNIQNLCGLIYITLCRKFPSLVHYVQPVCDTNTYRQCGHKPWIFTLSSDNNSY